MDEKKLTAVPPSKGYLVVDTKKCSGCMSCMMACTLAHHRGDKSGIIQNSDQKECIWKIP